MDMSTYTPFTPTAQKYVNTHPILPISKTNPPKSPPMPPAQTYQRENQQQPQASYGKPQQQRGITGSGFI